MKWYKSMGIKSDNLRFRNHEVNEIAHYARFATDIEYQAPLAGGI
jgi:glycyl-tRNA synthetase